MKVLVTGASGFLGNALIKRLVEQDNSVVALARNEGELIKLQQKFPQIQIMTGDISDRYICEQACEAVRTVYHLAGFKHVGWAENQPKECASTNIIGTINVLSAAVLQKCDTVIGISTDKAAQVSGVYGASKLIMEALFRQYESFNPEMKFRIVRYGNVLYSTGSVLCKWRDLLKTQGSKIIITNREATRYYWTVEQAIDLIFHCLNYGVDASPFIPQMKSIRLGKLLDCMMEKYGSGFHEEHQIGLGPGENLHETMDGINFSDKALRYSKSEILSMI